MAAIKTSKYGERKITGLKRTAGRCCWSPYDSIREEVFVDISTGEMWSNTPIGDNWTVYHDRDVVRVGFYAKATMAQLARDAAAIVSEADAYGAEGPRQ